MKKYCDFCCKEYNVENHHKWMAHRSNCDFRPNKEIKSQKLINYHKTQLKEFKINCKKCNKEIILNITKSAFFKGDHKKYCSRNCANSHVVSDETKKKISISQLTSEKFKLATEKRKTETQIKNKESRICEGCGEIFICEKWKKKKFCNIKCIGKSTQYKKNKSKNLKEQYKNGKKIYGGKTKWLAIETSIGLIKVQGTYELRTCKILEKLKELKKIKNWEYTTDRFQYISIDKKKHYYLIDFKIFRNDNSFYYLEVKGYEKSNDKLKWKAVRKKGFELIVWFNNDIIKYENKYGDCSP